MVASAEPAPVPNAASPVEEPSAPVTEPAKPAAEPPQAKSALRAMPALLEKPTANAQLAKAVPAKTAARSSPTHRAKSLDDLISQIMASR